MKTTEQSSVLGLDIGTSHIVAARYSEENFQYERELNAFVSIPYTKLAESLMTKENINHAVKGKEILVFGNESQQFAELFHVETRRPMMDGILNPSESDGLLVIRQIITRLLGRAKKPGQRMYFSVPAPAAGVADDKFTFHETTLREVLCELGYDPKSITEGLAVVYGELGDSNFTGIGVSCGGGMCNVCLAYLSVPVISFSVPKGGDYIDANSAAAISDLATSVRVEKERGFRFNGFFENKTYHALSVYYDDVIQSLVKSMHDAFSNTSKLPKLKQPVPMLLSGGTTMPPGFRERFEKALRASDFPIELAQIRTAADPLHSTAKGTVIATLCEA
ncbi:MAG TPA: hypothetical protein VNH18_27935 [Bryobacteraceae bacterium]|jgi:hypothetical protein|nr:hypothetical protein [Bryobacteraceae bacterium]HXJ43142.1 hypothetical protein [Bryobacteraceae bacterium]